MNSFCNSRKTLILAIAEQGLASSQSLLKSTDVHRIPHHLDGLLGQGYIEIAKNGTKRGQKIYRLSRSGRRVFNEIKLTTTKDVIDGC
jgi:predicted ArsR family transcriptional regulator